MVTLTCARCGKQFQRLHPRPETKFCSQVCQRMTNYPRIPDGQPVSKRTQARRKKEAGLTKPALHWRPFNEDFFAVWSDELAWVLGLIWSDGCLRGNGIEICSKDRDLMEAVAVLIGSEGAVKPKGAGRAYRVRFTSQRVAQFLRELGLIERKSFTANWPAIPDEYRSAFVRGLLDGDGWVSLKQKRPGQQAPDLTVGFCGAAPAVREGLHWWLGEHGVRFHSRMAEPTVWQITVKEQSSLRVLYHLLYHGDEVSTLRRKKANYDTWMVTPRAGSSAGIRAAIARKRTRSD